MSLLCRCVGLCAAVRQGLHSVQLCLGLAPLIHGVATALLLPCVYPLRWGLRRVVTINGHAPNTPQGRAALRRRRRQLLSEKVAITKGLLRHHLRTTAYTVLGL